MTSFEGASPSATLDRQAEAAVRPRLAVVVNRDGGTVLTLRMRYRVSTHLNWYAGPVADLLGGDLGDGIIRFLARRAGAPCSRGSPLRSAQ